MASCHFVAISDTHGRHEALGKLPDCDVLLCAGDFTNRGRPEEVASFIRWLIEEQTHIPQKLITPGNHELSLAGLAGEPDKAAALELLTNADARAAGIELLIGATATTRVGGYRVFGSPVTPWFWGGFMLREDKIGREWEKIPTGVDVVMTHGPARGHGDTLRHGAGEHAGCPILLREILDRVRPAVCIAGHIHEGRGASEWGGVTFLNVSTCNVVRHPVHPPVRFRLERRAGESRGGELPDGAPQDGTPGETGSTARLVAVEGMEMPAAITLSSRDPSSG